MFKEAVAAEGEETVLRLRLVFDDIKRKRLRLRTICRHHASKKEILLSKHVLILY